MSESHAGQHQPGSYRPHNIPKAMHALQGGKTTTEEQHEAGSYGKDVPGSFIIGKSALHLPAGPDLAAAAEWYAAVFELEQPEDQRIEGAQAISLRLPAGEERLVLWRTDSSRPGMTMTLGEGRQPVATFNVQNVDRIHERVLAAGGESLMKPCDLFFRTAMFQDPFGNELSILQEPLGWGKRIGRPGEAATFDWLKIPVRGTADDLLRTASWYTDNLGLEPGPLTAEQDGLDLHPGNLHLQLVDTDFSGRFAEGSRSVPLAELETSEIERLYGRLEAIGTDISDLQEEDGVRSFTFVDPNGVVLGAVQR